MQKLTISIVTWNSAESISACLKSVLEQTFSDFRLVVVDNNSNDATCVLIEAVQDRRISLFKKTENTGFCGGHNFSISNSESEFVLLVNPDIIMAADYVATALATIQSDERIGTLCGLLLQDEHTGIIDSAGLEFERSGIMSMRFHGKNKTECNLINEEIFGADGALPLYRRSMINDISYYGQFFDELFFAHKEDWDVSWRSSLFGWKTVFDPAAVAIHPRHFKPKSLAVRKNMSSSIKIDAVKNQLMLLLKNASTLSFLKNGVFILSRQLLILFYILLFERSSLKAYGFVIRNYRAIIAKRRIIQRRRVS